MEAAISLGRVLVDISYDLGILLTMETGACFMTASQNDDDEEETISALSTFKSYIKDPEG